jgi:hypothetical protein
VAGFSAAELLRLPVRVRGIELGRPVDVLVDVEARRAVGLEVLCGDDRHRFLPLAVGRVGEDEIAIESPLLLFEFSHVGFYRDQTMRLQAMRGQPVDDAGPLRDIVLGSQGQIEAVVVDRGRLPLDGIELPSSRRDDGRST